MFFSTAFFAFAAAGLASSQSLSSLGLSQPCTDALSAITTNTALSQCLSIINALNILTTTANTSIIPAVNTWVNGLCAAPTCQQSDLQAAANNISTSCATDAAKADATQGLVTNIANSVVQFYPQIREIACLKDSNQNNNNCVSTLLSGVEGALGSPLSLNELAEIPNAITSGQINEKTIPSSVLCTDCTKGAWSIVKENIPAVASSTAVTDAIQSECGADFVSATTLPANIAQGTGGSNSGAVSLVNTRAIFATASVSLLSLMAGMAMLM